MTNEQRIQKIKNNTQGVNVLALETGDLEFLIQVAEQKDCDCEKVTGDVAVKEPVDSLCEE